MAAGNIAINMILRTEQMQRDMTRVRGQISGLESTFKGLGSTMLRIAGIGGGIYAVERGFRSIVTAASNAEEISNKFNVVFGNLSKTAQQWSEDFGDSVGRATQDVQNWMAGLQDTFVPLGIARDESYELSKALTTLAVDVASFNNKADADVIRDFTSALVGNHETVRKYGILISESSIKQAAMNKGWEKSYSQLTDLEKVMLRFDIIQNSTTDAQGDAIRTADSYANQIKRLNANALELKTTLGEKLVPALAAVVKEMNDILKGEPGGGLGQNRLQNQFQKLTGWSNELTVAINNSGIKNAADLKEFIANWNQQQLLASQQQSGLVQTDTVFNEDLYISNQKAADDINKIYAQMYKDMGQYDQDWYNTQKVLLYNQAEEWTQAGADVIKVRKWMTNELSKIDDQQSKHAKDLLDEQLEYTKQQYEASLQEQSDIWGLTYQQLADMNRQFGDTIADSFEDVAVGAKSATDAVKELAQELARIVFRQTVTQPLANAITAGLNSAMGVPTMHTGGMVGYGSYPSRMVSSSLFANAPRLHSGLASDEFPAILQRGERVIPKNQAAGQQPINIKNVIVKNEEEAMLEVMNSRKGEKVIVSKWQRNRNILR